MGRSTTPTYVVDIPGSSMPAAWRREYGRPTAANLKKYMETLVASIQPGGCNSHLIGWNPTKAVLRVNCYGGSVLATWEMSYDK